MMFYSIHVFSPIYRHGLVPYTYSISVWVAQTHMDCPCVYGMDLVGFKFIHDVACFWIKEDSNQHKLVRILSPCMI